jgi:hypothetical protein
VSQRAHSDQEKYFTREGKKFLPVLPSPVSLNSSQSEEVKMTREEVKPAIAVAIRNLEEADGTIGVILDRGPTTGFQRARLKEAWGGVTAALQALVAAEAED